ncbi:MAG: hypothetical protein KGN36_09330, partial [Acidobacteriota bacterium]|nr:hypothetical protein [Acidobacteriota bacterium]
PDTAAWRWGLRLRSYGYAGQERRVENGRPGADAEGFSYQWNSDLREFYVNSAGLEHGYTISRRSGEGASLRLHLEVLGTLQPQIRQDGAAVAFNDAGGNAVILYGSLKVTDADGKRLPARFAGEGRAQFRLEIDDEGARYPLMVAGILRHRSLRLAAELARTVVR